MTDRIARLNRFTRGWTAYFALADTPSVFAEFDEWLRRRLRQVRWKECKRWRNLCVLGIPTRTARQWAASRRGCWRVAGPAILQRALHMPTGRLRVWSDTAFPTGASGCSANRRMRARMSGGVGGAGVSPALPIASSVRARPLG